MGMGLRLAAFGRRSSAMNTGLTILDRLPKKKKNTLKVTKLTSCMDFRMIQAVIKCCERSTVERIRKTCPAVIISRRNKEQKVDN